MGGVAARKIASDSWELQAGVVRAAEGDALRVALESGAACVAERAASCLLAPEPGDRVLVGWSSGEAYVLSVLRRDGQGPARLVTRGDTELRVEGKLSLGATERIEATSPTISMAARSWLLRAADAVVSTERLSLSSARALLEMKGVEAVLGAVEAVAEHVLQRVGRSVRHVEDVDQVRAGRIDMAAESTMSVHAHDTLMTADGLVKVDAEQIQLG